MLAPIQEAQAARPAKPARRVPVDEPATRHQPRGRREPWLDLRARPAPQGPTGRRSPRPRGRSRPRSTRPCPAPRTISTPRAPRPFHSVTTQAASRPSPNRAATSPLSPCGREGFGVASVEPSLEERLGIERLRLARVPATRIAAPPLDDLPRARAQPSRRRGSARARRPLGRGRPRRGDGGAAPAAEAGPPAVAHGGQRGPAPRGLVARADRRAVAPGGRHGLRLPRDASRPGPARRTGGSAARRGTCRAGAGAAGRAAPCSRLSERSRTARRSSRPTESSVTGKVIS